MKTKTDLIGDDTRDDDRMGLFVVVFFLHVLCEQLFTVNQVYGK